MPQTRPGIEHYAVATKAVAHGLPCVEDGVAGQAFKQVSAVAGVGYGDSKITTVQVGEQFIIHHKGQVEFVNSRQEGGTFAKGDAVYIRASDNLLTATSTSNVKMGRVDAIAPNRGLPTG